MHELQKQFHNFIQTRRLVENDQKVLLAVSGGLDSMVMLDLFLKSEIKFAVAHCNFGLRGSESDADEQLVQSYSDQHNIDCFVKKVVIEGKSIQLEARERRYEWFEALSKSNGFHKIATAHHLNDSLETTLLNLVRGTGIKGLAGIPLTNGNIIRPLLFATKEKLLEYAKDQQVEWREDASNQKTTYDRNKVRLEIIPKLQDLNPSLSQTFKNTKERLDLLQAMLSDQVEEMSKKYFDQNTGELQLSWIKKEQDLLLISELLSSYGFNYVTVKEIFEVIGEPGKVFEIEGWKVIMDRESLFVQKRSEMVFEEVFIEDAGVYQVGSGKLEIRRAEVRSIELEIRQKVEVSQAIIEFFDGGKLTFPFRVREWRVGDYIQPLGMKGKKKVSDLLIDLKVPLAKKQEVLVLESRGEIAWVIGYRISEKFKIDDETSQRVKIELGVSAFRP